MYVLLSLIRLVIPSGSIENTLGSMLRVFFCMGGMNQGGIKS